MVPWLRVYPIQVFHPVVLFHRGVSLLLLHRYRRAQYQYIHVLVLLRQLRLCHYRWYRQFACIKTRHRLFWLCAVQYNDGVTIMQYLSDLKYPPQNYQDMTIDGGGFTEFGELFANSARTGLKLSFSKNMMRQGQKPMNHSCGVTMTMPNDALQRM